MSEACDLFVASAGGHLTQLHLLAGRLQPARPRAWVSYDHPHAHGLIGHEELFTAHGPSTRSVRALVGNWRLAGRLLTTGRFDRVVSSGAGIAVPFLVRAERLGIEAHYVESATRTDGPSLSGRILQLVTRDVQLHAQHEEWSGGRWGLVSSVFEGFTVCERDAPPSGRGLRVVVSLGTHRYPFTRLVDAVLAAVGPDDSVLLQHGSTPVPAAAHAGIDARATVSGDTFAEMLRGADLVVAHAGTGIVLSALMAGHRPVVVPRRVEFGEHVDDHQMLTAARLDRAGLALVTRAEELTREVLVRAAAHGVIRDDRHTMPIHLSS